MQFNEEYPLGCDMWCFVDDHQGDLTKGKLVHQFMHGNLRLYVIEIDTPVDPFYEVRDWMTISTDGRKINFWKNKE